MYLTSASLPRGSWAPAWVAACSSMNGVPWSQFGNECMNPGIDSAPMTNVACVTHHTTRATGTCLPVDTVFDEDAAFLAATGCSVP
jgi:hypothetical protein